jgi:hypothetical protein
LSLRGVSAYRAASVAARASQLLAGAPLWTRSRSDRLARSRSGFRRRDRSLGREVAGLDGPSIAARSAMTDALPFPHATPFGVGCRMTRRAIAARSKEGRAMHMFGMPGLFVGAVLVVVPLWRLCSRLGFPGPLALLALIPLANVILLYYLAYADWPRDRSSGAPTT